MNHQIYFWSTFIAIALAIAYFDLKKGMLRDSSTDPNLSLRNTPFSFSRVQFAWWMTIVLTSLITVVFMTEQIPTLNESTLILLGISTATTAAARLIDVSDMQGNSSARHQNQRTQGLLNDILSDEKGVSLYRFQALILNLTFGFWFIHTVLENIASGSGPIDAFLPDIQQNNLILLGLSSGTYAAFKSGENRIPSPAPPPPPPPANVGGAGGPNNNDGGPGH